ncbi:mitochondrial ribosomal subunit protein-domain-containing protein [Podospora didyma]|uniref:Mitochondrial ribosomal subunit protein-domain-containing protein n=1 Tax=Podospora didyma TaxID=330526 RepID=A0AAE0TVM8_9PEZI|nr:mitochondrial ribosomal subunit protein-domain-containing protein [Podospora didyma]
MASAANTLRLCLRNRAQIPCIRPSVLKSQSPLGRRALSTSALRLAREEKEDTSHLEPVFEFNKTWNSPGEFLKEHLRDETISPLERQQAAEMLQTWEQQPESKKREIEQLRKDIVEKAGPLRRPVLIKRDSFWNANEKDTDYVTNEFGEDDFEEDDILSMGHGKLEEHREAREYARLTVWEMPLLAKFAKPFVPPADGECLRFRYTSYLGEFHPADRKVVVEFSPPDLPGLTRPQRRKLKLLAGPRYNPEKDIIKMSCERFEHQAQNKRYLGDLVAKMIETAKDPTDMFEDIPLDTRHHTFKAKPKFPKEWLMSEARQQEIKAARTNAMMLDEQRKTDGEMVDGVKVITGALSRAEPVVHEPVMASRRSNPSRQQSRPQMRR